MKLVDCTEDEISLSISREELETFYRIAMTANLKAESLDPEPFDFTQDMAAQCAVEFERLLQETARS